MWLFNSTHRQRFTKVIIQTSKAFTQQWTLPIWWKVYTIYDTYILQEQNCLIPKLFCHQTDVHLVALLKPFANFVYWVNQRTTLMLWPAKKAVPERLVFQRQVRVWFREHLGQQLGHTLTLMLFITLQEQKKWFRSNTGCRKSVRGKGKTHENKDPTLGRKLDNR